MLADFFQLGPIPANQMLGSYDLGLVVLSYLVATFASYIALDFTGRLRDASNTPASNLFWLLGGSVAMGAGIWSMHFIGMLSFSMPDMKMSYDLFWTGLSLLVAILASFFALSLLKIEKINLLHLAIGGIILGFAIASMHYTGMEAMKTTMNIHYLPGIFFLSIVIAIIASEAALWLAIKSNQAIARVRIRLKLISASIMGIAICGMHYTGMVAAVFTPINHTHATTAIDPTVLSLSVAALTFVILGIAFFASTYKEAINQRQLEAARQIGMAEVSASVLHNVGNVLNSVNVSANVLHEKISNSKLAELNNLNHLLAVHKNDLATYLTQDPRGIKIPDFLQLLTTYWQDEQKTMMAEVELLRNNLQHIKEIISTQQGISKITGMETLIDINEILNESILITGLDNTQNEIIVEKECAKIRPILADKVKLLQVLVNVLKNSKDSLRASSKKTIIVKVLLKNNKTIQIKVIDSGCGISTKDFNKIFTYGFTTKELGHGFGLHASALAINEMGGSIKAESAGVGSGAIFILEIPYRLPKK